MLILCRGIGGLWVTCFGRGFGGGSRRGLLGRLGLVGLGGGFLLGGGGWGGVLGAFFWGGCAVVVAVVVVVERFG